jgi:hypothetical protein
MSDLRQRSLPQGLIFGLIANLIVLVTNLCLLAVPSGSRIRPEAEVTRIAKLAASQHADGVDDVNSFVANRYGSAGDARVGKSAERDAK